METPKEKPTHTPVWEPNIPGVPVAFPARAWQVQRAFAAETGSPDRFCADPEARVSGQVLWALDVVGVSFGLCV